MSAMWNKSSHCISNGNYVEVTQLPVGSVGIRNSRDTEGPVLQFTPEEWQAFLGGVRFGEFDDDPPDDTETAPHLPSCTQARGPDVTRLLSVSRIGQTDRGDMSCTDRAASRYHVTSRLKSRSIHKGTKPTGLSRPAKNRQMFNPHHVESGDV